MRLEIIRDEAGFLALKPCWDELLEQAAICSPFLRWDWMWFWWEEFRSDFEMVIAVVRDASNQVLAIAPLMIGLETEGLRRHLRHLGFLSGLGAVKGERMDFIVPAGKEAELTPVLCRAFQLLIREWDAVRLNKLPEESPNYPYILAALKEHCVGVSVVTRTECLCVNLAGSWPEFEAAMPGKRRRELRRRYENFNEAYPVKEAMVAGEDAEPRLDEFARLHSQHYPEGVSSFITPRSWRFHRRLGCKWIAEGRAIMPFLTLDSAMTAGLYGFIERNEFFFFQIGWDASMAKYSLGHLTIRWAMINCIQRQVRVFDMLPGTYRYKADWSNGARQVLDLEAYPPDSLKAALFQGVRHLKRLLSPASVATHDPKSE